jgi:hypothetical protein
MEERKNGLAVGLLSIASATILALVGWWGINMQMQVNRIRDDQIEMLQKLNSMDDRLILFEERQRQVLQRLGVLEK